MLAAENWCVKVDDKVYGPYTSEQMRKYAHEGRLAAWSLIAPAGSRAWIEARKEAAFSNFFGYDVLAKRPAPTGRTFGKRDDAEVKDVGNDNKTTKPQADLQVANFIIIFDVISASASRVEAAVHSLGNAFRVADNVWSVSSDLTAVGVRNSIAPYLTPRESIFVIDATRGRTSWQNYAPETQAKISAAFTAARGESRSA